MIGDLILGWLVLLLAFTVLALVSAHTPKRFVDDFLRWARMDR